MPAIPGNAAMSHLTYRCFSYRCFHQGALKAYLSLPCVLLLLLYFNPYFNPSAVAQEVGVRAQLSASTITRDESVVLTVTAIGLDNELDASALNRDFDVVGRSSSREVRIVSGTNNQDVQTSVVSWQLELLPKGVGVYTVPAVKVGDFETQLLTLTVNEEAKGAKRDIFLEASVDNTNPWVQSQVLMSLRVYQAVDIVDGGLDSPSADNLVVERVGEDTRSRQVLDGREYSVTERQFALFPQKSGTVTIDPITLSVTVPAEPDRVRGFFSPTRKLTRRSDPITLNVRPRPVSGSAWWLPAKNVDVISEWQGDPQSAMVDQPLTRTIVMRAQGVQQSQLPQVNIPAVEGVSLYADDPQLAMGSDSSGLISEQRINWALIPQRSGTVQLPAIEIEWFNTITGKIETAELPAETINVAPASGANAALSRPDSTSGNGVLAPDTSGSGPLPSSEPTGLSLQDSGEEQQLPNGDLATNQALATLRDEVSTLQGSLAFWRVAALSLTGLMGVVALMWFFRFRGTQAAGERKTIQSIDVPGLYNKVVPMNQLDKACEQGDIPQIKIAVLAWAAHQWPDNAPITLDALQKRLNDPTVSNKLSQLQAGLYSQTGYKSDTTELVSELANLSHCIKSAMQNRATSHFVDGINTPLRSSSIASASTLPKL